MLIGCPTEIKPQEFRVGITPNAAQEAIANGHQVVMQAGAGLARALRMKTMLPQARLLLKPQKRSLPARI
jgi:alanine dehydrogenase